jgi:hypothetical protein
VPGVVDGPRLRRERGAVLPRVNGGARWPVLVAVPLDQVDFATDLGMVVGQPPGRPATVGEAVELDAGFPGEDAPPSEGGRYKGLSPEISTASGIVGVGQQ